MTDSCVNSSLRALLAADRLPRPPVSVGDPRKHQIVGWHYVNPQPASMLAWGMGSGKSKVVVDAVQNWPYPRTVILCPVAVMAVWRREFHRWGAADNDVGVHVLDKGTCDKKAGEALDLASRYKAAGRRLVLVVNYESAWRGKLAAALMQIAPQVVVADEIHRIKAPGGSASRWVGRFGLRAVRRLGLTGTPMPHSPLDVYAQFRFLDNRIFGTSFTRFRNEFAICDPQYPSRVLKFVNMERFHERLHSISYLVKTTDVLDLPPISHSDVIVEMPARARNLYRRLEEEAIAEVGDGVVMTPHILQKLIRLGQITSGFLPTEVNGEESVEVLGEWKEKALQDIIEDANEPVSVFCRWHRDLDAVHRVCARVGLRCGELSGRRNDLTEHAMFPPDKDVMAVQIQSGGVGIDLTRSALAVYFSANYSTGDYDQSVARLHRLGQDRHTRIVHLVCPETVDESIYSAISGKREISEAVLLGLKSHSRRMSW